MLYQVDHEETISKRVKRLTLSNSSTADQKTVIMKHCSRSDPDFEKFRQGFMLEYQYMSKLNHSGLPAYYYIRTTCSCGNYKSFSPNDFVIPDNYMNNSIFIIMEDCAPIADRKHRSQTLYSFLNNSGPDAASPAKRINDGVILNIVRTLSEILNHLKENNVLYLDLNPDNIIIDRNMNLKLIDFTFCKYLNLKEHSNTQLLFVPKCCGKITNNYYEHYSSGRVPFSPDELLTAAFVEFYTHLFYKSRLDYIQHYQLIDFLEQLPNFGYNNRKLLAEILNTGSFPIPSDYRLPKFTDWFETLRNQLS